MGNALALTRMPIVVSIQSVLRAVVSAKVNIYDTLADGTSPVDVAGTVNAAAVKSTIFADRDATVVKDNPQIADSQGLIEFYSPRKTAHILIESPDGIKYGIPWYPVGGYPALDVGDSHVDFRDYPSLAIAISKLGSRKGIVHCPAGSYHAGSIPSINKGVTIPQNVQIKGDGYRSTPTIFTLTDGGNPNDDWFTLQGSGGGGQQIEGIYFRGLRDSIGAGTGRLFIIDGCNGTMFRSIFLDQICGIPVETVFTSGLDNVNNHMDDVVIQSSGSHGIKLGVHTFHTILHRTNIISRNGNCIWTMGQNLRLASCAIEPNDDTVAAIKIDGARQFYIDNTWFEYNPPAGWFIELVNSPSSGSYGSSIRNCRFVRVGATQSLRAVKSTGNYSWVMDNNIGIFANGITPVGTDDIQLNTGDKMLIQGQHKLMTDNMATIGDWRINGLGGSRLARHEFYRQHLGNLNESLRDDGSTIPDIFAGDFIFNGDSLGLQAYNGSAWGMSLGRYIEGTEMADPAAPVADRGRLYFRDNGAGKTQIVVVFSSGAVQVIATQP